MQQLKFQRRRQQLVAELREKGIRDESVLSAMGKIPRHEFIDNALEHRAYEDSALPIGLNQTISQPYTVARQTELLELVKGEKVLEIGTGSGFQCAVLCEMGMKVFSVERHQLLHERSREMMRLLGYKPMLKCGDGTIGWSAYAPYDAIVVTAGAPVVPDDLRNQLNLGGRLVIPVGDEQRQLMMRIWRLEDQHYREETYDGFKFVPLIGQKGW